jgi:hypothetical protein
MAVQSVNDLKRIMFDAYSGFADKRIKNLGKGIFFVVDGRRSGDFDARGDLFLWFCQIGLKVEDRDTVTLTLRGGVPESARVKELLAAMGAKQTAFATEVEIPRGRESTILELATAFRAITSPGARYGIKAYKYVCPRAASSLASLANILHEAWVD